MMSFVSVYKFFSWFYYLLAIISLTGLLLLIFGDIVMSKMIHDIMFILVFLGGGVVFYEERKYPENFEGNPRLFSTRAEFVSRPLKIIQAALAAVLLLAVVPMFFDIQFGLLSKFDEFNLVQGVFVTLATLTLQPVFAYRKSMLSNEQKNN